MIALIATTHLCNPVAEKPLKTRGGYPSVEDIYFLRQGNIFRKLWGDRLFFCPKILSILRFILVGGICGDFYFSIGAVDFRYLDK